jgi:hypothetical protein
MLILWLSSYLPQVTPKGYKKGFCHWTGLGTVHPLQKNICWKNSPRLKYRLKKPSILLVLNHKRFNHAVVELQQFQTSVADLYITVQMPSSHSLKPHHGIRVATIILGSLRSIKPRMLGRGGI